MDILDKKINISIEKIKWAYLLDQNFEEIYLISSNAKTIIEGDSRKKRSTSTLLWKENTIIILYSVTNSRLENNNFYIF